MLVEAFPWSESNLELYRRLTLCSGLAILDSSLEPRTHYLHSSGRWCFAAYAPFAILECYSRQARLLTAGQDQIIAGCPLAVLQKVLAPYQLPVEDSPTPLPAGAIGYFSYELGEMLVRGSTPGDTRFPLAYFSLYDAVISLDRHKKMLYFTSTGWPARGAVREAKAAARLNTMIETVFDPRPENPDCNIFQPKFSSNGTFYATGYSRSEYLWAVNRAQKHISYGDIYQVNLAQSFTISCKKKPFQLFTELVQSNPAPFSAYVQTPGFNIVSSSPERFLHYDPGSRLVHTRPIKGTRPRHRNKTEDQKLGVELLRSVKDRAEHIMIVDLERNDLSRVAARGSVEVPELMVLESFPTVWHLVSTVQAKLHADSNWLELFKAAFPGGSITGAPKKRAMEVIADLEPGPREIYTGTLGYFSFSGYFDFNIAIRTLVWEEGLVRFYAGGGIVADSEPEAEYQEILDKGRAFFQVLGLGGDGTWLEKR